MIDPFIDVEISSLPPLVGHVPEKRLNDARRGRRSGRRERRRSMRVVARAEVAARPVCPDGNPTGPAFRAMVTEISKGGLRLYCDQPPLDIRVAVKFGLLPQTVRIFEVLRVHTAGSGHECAGSFMLPIPIPAIGFEPAAESRHTESR